MAPKKAVPLSIKLKLLADQERGVQRKILLKKYKVKRSTYYRILSEKEAIRNYVLKGEPLPNVKAEDAKDTGNEAEDTGQKPELEESKEEVDCNSTQTLKRVDEAVMEWCKEQEAYGVPVKNEDIDEAAERLAQKLGFNKFKLNSSGWPLRFRKAQEAVRTPTTMNGNEGNPEPKVKKVLRIQDQITAFQRLQAGESAVRIGNDLGVSKTTILRVKKKLKDTLFTPSLDPQYKISVERLTARKRSVFPQKEKVESVENVAEQSIPEPSNDDDPNKESVMADIERRKQLRLKNGLSNRDRGLNYNEKIEAISQYKSGITLKQIAHNFGVSCSTIQRVKKAFSKSHKLHFKNYMKLQDKVSVLERLDEGETITTIAEDLGVHDTTIRAIKKNRLRIMNVYKASVKSLSRTSKKSHVMDKIDQRLLVWVNGLKRYNIPVSNTMIQKKAIMIHMNISQEEGGSSSQSFIPSEDWLYRFKRKYNIEKISRKESESEYDSEELLTWKAGPKSKKKKHIIGSALPSTSYSSLPHKGDLTLSKFVEGLREMYLTRNLPADPYRCNSFTPRVILAQQEENPEKKNEPLSDEETWLTAQTNAYSDTDWEDESFSTMSLCEVNYSNESPKAKRKIKSSEHTKKRRRLSEGEESDNRSVVDYNKTNFIDVPIKQEPQEPQSSLDSLHSGVPMAVLPAGSTYVPPLPMFQMPQGGLTVFMPESQQMMMQHPVSYPHENSRDLFMNQQQLRGRTLADSPIDQFNDIERDGNLEENVRQDNENMIVMPFGRDLCDQERSKQLSASQLDTVTYDSLAEKAKDRAAAIAESIGMTVEGSSHEKLRDLTFKLLELNNKNLVCDEKIQTAREEYEKTVSHIEAEKKLNDKEIDNVLAAIQEWKEAKSQSNS